MTDTTNIAVVVMLRFLRAAARHFSRSCGRSMTWDISESRASAAWPLADGACRNRAHHVVSPIKAMPGVEHQFKLSWRATRKPARQS
jgi:hypothetical protein